MTEKVRVNVQVPSSQRVRWGDYVDETPEFNSLSELVRVSVEREISGDNDPDGTGEMPEEIGEQLRDMAQEIEETHTTVRHVAQSVESPDERGKNLQSEIWAILPEDGELRPDEIADEMGGPVTPLDVGEQLRYMADDGHVTTEDGTNYRRVD